MPRPTTRARRAWDIYFGRVQGNGGDWFEMVVIKDHLDMRGWQLDTYVSAKLDKTLTLTADPLWSDLRAGTIITVAQDVPNRVSYNPAAGDWWINVQANRRGRWQVYLGQVVLGDQQELPVAHPECFRRGRLWAGGRRRGPERESQRHGRSSSSKTTRVRPSRRSRTDYDSNHHFSTFGARTAGARRISTICVP